MSLPSGVGDVPTPNVRPDVWDQLESYMICMLLACRLKIILSSNLKLIISFLVLPLVFLSSFNIRSAKQDDNYGASNIVLPCPGS